MKNLKVNELLFHGVRDTNYESAINIFENILIDKYILTHKSLREKGKIHERENSCYQGLNAISVCFHPINEALSKKFQSSGITITTELPAFYQFVDVCEPSIILDNNLLNELPYRSFGSYKRLIDEIQVLSNIPLSYAKAIGYKDITPDLTKRFHIYKSILVKKDNESYNKNCIDYYENVLKKELEICYQNITIIKELLKKHNYLLNILDPLTGKKYQSFEEDEKEFKKTLFL